MNIQTKYKVGEQVFTINDNGKIVQFTINSITVDIYKDGSVEVLYHGKYDPQEKHSMLRDENACFRTETELMNMVEFMHKYIEE